MSATTPRARRIAPSATAPLSGESAARRVPGDAAGSGPAAEPVVDSTFTSVCAAVLLAAVIMAAILAMGSVRPVPSYAVFGAGLFGAVFGAFLIGALHLAVTDSRRHKDHDH